MTVKQLKQKLNNLPEDMEVYAYIGYHDFPGNVCLCFEYLDHEGYIVEEPEGPQHMKEVTKCLMITTA